MADQAVELGCPCGNEVDEQALMSQLDEILVEYRYKDGGLIPVLQIAQGLFGYFLAVLRLKRGLSAAMSLACYSG